MRVGCTALAMATVVSLPATAASGQTVLTLADVLTKAREEAPRVVSARLAVDEARGRLAGASFRQQSNPEIDLSVGNRQADDTRWTDFQVGATQMFEPPGRRSARVAGATALLDQSTASADVTAREVVREAAALFYRAVHASERIRVLSTSEELARAILDAAERRYRAGDLAILDVNLARAALARVRSERETAQAELAVATGALQTLLRIDTSVAVQGSLTPPSAPEPAALLQSADERPELRNLEAAVREADAEVSAGRTLAKPSYGVGLRYEREGGDHIVLGGVTVMLPVFSSGQALGAAGSARGARLRADLKAARATVRIEVDTSLAAYQRRLAAARVLETEALPGLEENATLAARSFEAGQIGLPDVLLIRREILETQLQYLSALLEAALARVALDSAAAVLR